MLRGFPLPVLRELLLNAVIHKDYRDPTDVIIKMFDEHIEFMNPGELFGTLKLEALQTDFYRASHRNKLLAEAFYLTGEVEKYGTGFIRIRARLSEESPNTAIALRSESGAFTISIGDIDVSQKTSVKSSVKILDLLGKNADMTIPELADRIGITTRGVEKSIRKLQDTGALKRVGPDKGDHWEVINNEDRD